MLEGQRHGEEQVPQIHILFSMYYMKQKGESSNWPSYKRNVILALL